MSLLQTHLPGFEAEPPPFRPEAVGQPLGYTLLVMALPHPEDAERISAASLQLRRRYSVRGGVPKASNLHVTLHRLGAFPAGTAIPRTLVDAAQAAVQRVSWSGGDSPLVFDRLLTFENSKAFVLRCDTGSDAALDSLRDLLTLELRRFSLRPKPSYTPHMTLCYDASPAVPEQPIEPIRWRAAGFGLILSHVGLGHHQRIGVWRH